MAGWGSPITNQNIKSTGKNNNKYDIYGRGDSTEEGGHLVN